MREGNIQEDDGGWADAYKGRVGMCYFGDSGQYDASFQFTMREAEAHRIKEAKKSLRAPVVDGASEADTKRRKARRSALSAYKADLVALLRKRGPMTSGEIQNAIGKPSIGTIGTAIMFLRIQGLLEVLEEKKVSRSKYFNKPCYLYRTTKSPTPVD